MRVRMLEYFFSASVMKAVLVVISGGRDSSLLLAIWVLMGTTQAMGFLTELGSNIDPASNGERWVGDAPDGSNYRSNYLKRMAPHFTGFLPYCTSWYLIVKVYADTLGDVQERFPGQVDSLVPTYIVSAIASTCAIFSSFTLCQLWYQFQKPREYWKTECWYALLSLVAKGTLGCILLANLLYQNAREGSAGGDSA